MAKIGNESTRRKIYRAGSFAISAMFCPGCRVDVEEPVDQCPQCGYSGHSAVEKFPFAAPALERYIDPNEHFSGADREVIDRSLHALAQRFPQPRFCFCVVDLEKETDPREFGFWMLNASPVSGPDEERLRSWTILVVIDDANGRASITPGYAIEPFLNEERWATLLLQERPFFSSRNYGTAVVRFLDGAMGVLSEGAERTERILSYRRLENRYPERWWK